MRKAVMALAAAAFVALAAAAIYLRLLKLALLKPEQPVSPALVNVEASTIGGPFALTDQTGKRVASAALIKGPTLIYFGYTFCPDICPLTLANVSRVLRNLGDKAKNVRVLFVTVDPNRDTLPVLKKYTESFGPEVVGLRGNADQIAALAKRYRVAYSVTPEKDGKPYTVTHSSAIYVFDQTGKVRLLITSMASPTPDVDGATADIGTLIDQGGSPSFWQRLWQMV
jgi:protein SCO1/2